MNSQEAFALALRQIRRAKDRSQEDFDDISRTYISALERGLKSPTLRKVDAIAAALSIQPLTLLLATYSHGSDVTLANLLVAAQEELEALGLLDPKNASPRQAPQSKA